RWVVAQRAGSAATTPRNRPARLRPERSCPFDRSRPHLVVAKGTHKRAAEVGADAHTTRRLERGCAVGRGREPVRRLGLVARPRLDPDGGGRRALDLDPQVEDGGRRHGERQVVAGQGHDRGAGPADRVQVELSVVRQEGAAAVEAGADAWAYSDVVYVSAGQGEEANGEPQVGVGLRDSWEVRRCGRTPGEHMSAPSAGD